jgi:hypothetical protein
MMAPATIRITFEGDGRDGNDPSRGELPFEVIVLRLAFGEPESRSIVMNHEDNVIGIVECLRASIERRIVESPFWRRDLPDELCNSLRIFHNLRGLARSRSSTDTIIPTPAGGSGILFAARLSIR